MKQPKPTAPFDAPPGTMQLGGSIEWFSASLSVSGEFLNPKDITELLGREPSKSWTKGEPASSGQASSELQRTFGRWSIQIKASDTDEWDVSEIITTLFAELPQDAQTWERVATLGHVRVAVALNLPNSSSRDLHLEPEVLLLLARRRARLWFDIYASDDA